MASKRGPSETPLTGQPETQMFRNLRNRLVATSCDDTSNEIQVVREPGGRGSRNGQDVRGGRGGTGGRGGSARVGAGRGSGPLNEENNQDIDKGIGRGDGTNIGVSNLDKHNNQTSVENSNNNILQIENAVEESVISNNESFSVTQMLNLAENNKFPEKKVTFGSKIKSYTSVLQFFNHNTKFDKKPDDQTKIKFKCKEDGCNLQACFGDFSNLNKHLKIHERTNRWYMLYKNRKSFNESDSGSKLSKTKILLIKFFITSNLALKQLENVYLRQCLKDEIKMPCIKTFKFTYLEEVFAKVFNTVEEKCNGASYITLIPDCWSDKTNAHYLGIFILNKRTTRSFKIIL